jgi:DNA polymerase V
MLSARYEHPKCIALVDCNNFYASCERVFRPDWEKRPLGVLSNNDGCIIARSSELKDAGIPMGAPYFKHKAELDAMKAVIVSSNYALYGDMSYRVMNVLSRHTAFLEVYSIDEAWLDLNGVQEQELIAFGENVVNDTLKCTGIPVSMGIAQTKVLAKIANRLCKLNKIPGQVFNMGNAQNIDEILSCFPVEDIWGIGKQLFKKLASVNIRTAKDLRDADSGEMRQIYGVVMQRIIFELRGIPCIDNEPQGPKKQIVVSKSFGQRVTEKEYLIEAASLYATRAGEKLRIQKSACGLIQIAVQSGLHNPRELTYSKSATVCFKVPTADTRRLISAARQAINKIFRPGIRYSKVSISLMDICLDNTVVGDLFNAPDSSRSVALMDTIDMLNAKYGKKTIKFASEGINQHWKMKQNYKTPAYTTKWGELPKVS